MPELEFRGTTDINALHDAILESIPDLRPYQSGNDEEGEPVFLPRMEVIGRGDLVWLTVPDSTDREELNLVVNDHIRQLNAQ